MTSEAAPAAVRTPAIGGRISRHGFAVLVCTSAPSFMLQLDANIVSVSLPSIARSLNADFAGIEWVVTAYMLSFASLLMPAGALADRFGRKLMLIIGLTVFTVASFLCGAAPNLAILIGARALQGAGAAMQLSSALATLSHEFHGEARARAFAFWGTVVGIGMSLGPIIGGLITQHFGWQWAFYVNLPIGIVLIAMIARIIETSRDPDATRFDLPGVACFASALFLTTLALIEGNKSGWTNPWIIGALGAALGLFVLFIAVELYQDRPMLDLAYFRRPTYLGANLAQLSFSAGMLTMLTFIPIFLQSGLGQTSGFAGLMMLPLVLPLFIVPLIVSRHLAHRLSGRALLTLGLFLVCLGLFWLALVVREIAYAPLVGGLVLIGIGAGMLNGETTKVGMTVIPRERAGMASGVSGTVRFTGLVLGITTLGAILYGGVAAAVADALPRASQLDQQALVHSIASGNVTVATLPGYDGAAMKGLVVQSLGSGYHSLFIAGALFMLLSTCLTWRLVSASETPPAQK